MWKKIVLLGVAVLIIGCAIGVWEYIGSYSSTSTKQKIDNTNITNNNTSAENVLKNTYNHCKIPKNTNKRQHIDPHVPKPVDNHTAIIKHKTVNTGDFFELDLPPNTDENVYWVYSYDHEAFRMYSDNEEDVFQALKEGEQIIIAYQFKKIKKAGIFSNPILLNTVEYHVKTQ